MTPGRGLGCCLGWPQGFLRVHRGAGLEECSAHVKPWKNKHGDGPCALFPGKCACTHRVLFVCFLTKACGFVSVSPRDRAWGRAGHGPSVRENVCWHSYVCLCTCWGGGQARKRGAVCACVCVCLCACVCACVGVGVRPMRQAWCDLRLCALGWGQV